jgi:mannose-6-phosphate isomerase-like protein (cupin superfamily)
MPELIEKAPDALVMRSKIADLEAVMKTMPQYQETLVHHFATGLYAREMRVEAGTVLVGKLHRRDCLNFIMAGEAEVVTEEGRFRVRAPEVFVSPAGTKRSMAALTDLVWITVHASTETDLGKLEAEMIANSHEELP